MPVLLDGLARMLLFDLKWEWEIAVPELGASVFEIPRKGVMGRKRSHMLIGNTVAQSINESQLRLHLIYVFTYNGHRVETINNSAWQLARRLANLDDLHVHDLRHRVGMRLREAEVRKETIADILWHNH